MAIIIAIYTPWPSITWIVLRKHKAGFVIDVVVIPLKSNVEMTLRDKWVLERTLDEWNTIVFAIFCLVLRGLNVFLTQFKS